MTAEEADVPSTIAEQLPLELDDGTIDLRVRLFTTEGNRRLVPHRSDIEHRPLPPRSRLQRTIRRVRGPF